MRLYNFWNGNVLYRDIAYNGPRKSIGVIKWATTGWGAVNPSRLRVSALASLAVCTILRKAHHAEVVVRTEILVAVRGDFFDGQFSSDATTLRAAASPARVFVRL